MSGRTKSQLRYGQWPDSPMPAHHSTGLTFAARRLAEAALEELARHGVELRGKVGDGGNQAADLISATASIPSLNFIPLTTLGNWF